jgi:3-deoxy-D-manno-octulosonic-acid transferase
MAETKRVDPTVDRSRRPSASSNQPLIQWIYRGLFNFGLLISFLYYFRRMARRGGWKDRVGQRFGRYETDFIERCSQGKRIWIHAVSVGEVHLTLELVKRLQEKLQDCKIIVSSTTTTGMGEWKKKLPPDIETCFYPIDRRPWVRRAMEVIRPEAIIMSEAEVWPNFLWEARQRNIPTFLINARISEKSFTRYKQVAFLFRPLFQSFARVGTQNKSDADRLMTLGCEQDRVQVTGNMKFDAALQGTSKPTLDVRQLYKDNGINSHATILLGSSTHAGEEAILGRIFADLKSNYPNLKLVVVPRHFERAREAARDLESAGLNVTYRSEWNPGTPSANSHRCDCLIVDSTGELASLYTHADLVFIGKSLCTKGGQSPIEAAAVGRAMVIGPNMQNFRTITRTFLSHEAAVQVPDAHALKRAISDLLEDSNARTTIGRKAKEVVEQNVGAIERSLEMITAHPALKSLCTSSKKQ